MYVDIVPNRGSQPAVLLRESWREGSRIRKRTLANLSEWEPEKVDLLRRVLRGERLVPLDVAFQVEESLPHGHVAAILGTLRSLGLERLVAARRSRERDLVVAMIAARVLDPRSKLATVRGFDHATSLADVLELGSVDVDELYRAMDWLLERQPQIEQRLARRHLQEGALVLYDVTSTYLEGRHCPLGRIGYSRDGKKNRLQIVFGLMTDAEGRPLAVEVFEGNTADPSTLASQVEKLQDRFGLKRVVVVGDRGMITEARIREDLRPRDLQWITSLRAPALHRLAAGGALQQSLFDVQDLAEIRDPAFPDERLIVCRNPLLGEERARKREALLQSTELELERIVEATRRPQRPLRGQDKIALRVGRVLGRFKVGKHFDLEITDTSLRYQRNPETIDAETALDGLYVIRTNVAKDLLSAEQTVQSYKNLSFAERAFRCLKTVDLKVRPIYHHLAGRVRAHVFLCALAYYVEWHMRQRLAPLLFDDEDPNAGRALRASVVAPAQRSPGADEKARTKRTESGLPVHAFHDLLRALQTLCRNRVRSNLPGLPTLVTCTQPTPLQEAAFRLLALRPPM